MTVETLQPAQKSSCVYFSHLLLLKTNSTGANRNSLFTDSARIPITHAGGSLLRMPSLDSLVYYCSIVYSSILELSCATKHNISQLVMAGEAERDPSTWYTLMEDKEQDKAGRRMTLPNPSVSMPNPAVRTSTFSTPSAPSTAAVAAATPQPDFSRRSEAAKTGILRQSTFTDSNISSDESPPKKRVKKQVSITLPGSARPLSKPPSRQGENERALSAIEEDGGSDDGGPQEVVVEVDVQEETETTDGE